MNEITEKADKATCSQPKCNANVEKDKPISARMGHSLCYYLPKWSLWGERMVYLKLNEVTFPWNVSLTRKLLCFNNQVIQWLSARKGVFLPSDLYLSSDHSRGKTILPLPAYFLKPPFQKHHIAWDTVFLIFIDFLSWRTLSLTALIITYIQMIFKFALHFQPFQMMSPFASPQIWLMSCLGWATILSDWIWMRWRLCGLVVNKL